MEHFCPICNSKTYPYDVVDFNKSCIEKDGKFLQKSLFPIYYFLCDKCNFCFAPSFKNWTDENFDKYIYNKDYVLVDPDYKERRPLFNSKFLLSKFKEYKNITHLDYGGGNGTLSNLLGKEGWNSKSFDKFQDKNTKITSLGKFNFITSYEVFEHVINIDSLMNDLMNLITNDGVILFSTLISDGNIKKNSRLTWWYASPRNGHISLFSKESLKVLAKRYDLNYISLNQNLHIFYKEEKSSILQTIIK